MTEDDRTSIFRIHELVKEDMYRRSNRPERKVAREFGQSKDREGDRKCERCERRLHRLSEVHQTFEGTHIKSDTRNKDQHGHGVEELPSQIQADVNPLLLFIGLGMHLLAGRACS